MTEQEEIEIRNAEYREVLRAYTLTFNSPSGQVVLLDLMNFCKFREPIDDRVDEGKRQVMLRIMNFTNMSLEQLRSAFLNQVHVQVSDTTKT